MTTKNQTTKTQRKSMAAELGRSGGRAIVRKRGKQYMKRIALRGARARWSNHKKSPKKQVGGF